MRTVRRRFGEGRRRLEEVEDSEGWRRLDLGSFKQRFWRVSAVKARQRSRLVSGPGSSAVKARQRSRLVSGPWCARTLGFAIGAVGALVSLSPGLLFQVFHQYSFMHRSRSPFVRASTLAHSQRWLRNFGSWPLRLAESPSLGFAACGRPSDSVHPKRRHAGYIENKKSRVW